MPKSKQFRRNLCWQECSGQIRPAGRSGLICPANRPEYGRRNLGLPDSDDIDRMLSNFGTGKISMMVDYLK
jgi:hypothetical protein